MWFSFLLGMEVHQEYVAPQPPEYKTVLLGYGPELRATQLELRQTADPPLHDRGSGFVRLVIAVDSLEAAREALTGAGEDFEEGFELPSVMDVLSPGQPALKCTAPDGWEVCLVQCC